MDQGIAQETSTFQRQGTTLRWDPIKFPVRPGMHGLRDTDASQNTNVLRSDFTGSQKDTYKMDEVPAVGGDQDGWKATHLNQMV